MADLKKRWKLFLGTIFDPWVLFLLVSIIALFYLSLGKTDPLVSSILFVFITMTSALLGGRIAKQWFDMIEDGVVNTRGKSAVRSLKMLLRSITALEERIQNFTENKDEINKNPAVTIRNYEEMIQTCNLLQEETMHSIENWTDIVPEADIKTQIGVISSLKSKLKEKGKDLDELKDKFYEKEDRSQEEKSRLKDEINEKEKQIEKLNQEIAEKEIRIGGVGLFESLSSITDDISLNNSHKELSGSKGIFDNTDFIGKPRITITDKETKPKTNED